jgi:dTDP-D-glucose 4,6-dehydratase
LVDRSVTRVDQVTYADHPHRSAVPYRRMQAARHFLRRGAVWNPEFGTVTPLTQLTLFDHAISNEPMPEEVMSDSRVRVLTGSLATPGVAAELIDRPDTTVLHLASMVSGDTEAAPQDGWTTNVEGQRLLLEALRESAPDARFLFTSSTATLGPVASEASAPDDTTKLLPLNTCVRPVCTRSRLTNAPACSI